MNILLTNWQDLRNPQAGGAEIHLFEIFSRLAARGHRIRLVCSSFPGAAPVEMVDGIEVHRSGTRFSFTLQGRSAIRRALRAEQPDVVVDDINKIPLRVASLTDRPVYAIVPHLFGRTIFTEASWPMASIVWAAEQVIPSAYRRAWFHAISESTRDDLIARGIPRERICVLHPGVDTTWFAPDPTGAQRISPPTFVYLGRLRRYKGVEFLLEAMAQVRETHPTARLDIAGAGVDRARLEARAAALGLGAQVRFLGFVDEAAKRELLRGAVANMFPSPKEGWGITVMEAAGCRTPSIASDSPGLRDSVRHGETGILVPHGNVSALVGAMRSLLDEPGRVERLGEAAREYAVSHRWDGVADAVEQHLQHLTAGSPPPSFAS